MTTEETVMWLKIIRTDLKNFPEVSNSKKIEALTAAIDIAEAFESFTDPNVSDKASYKKFEKLMNKSEWVNGLIEKYEESRWIPVSERLPKVADCYTVTRQIGDVLIVDACYFDGVNKWHDDKWINHERKYVTNIVAWMEQPQPYRPESEEEK